MEGGVMGFSISMCETCGHYHGRFTRYCMEPGCVCPEGPSPSVAAKTRPAMTEDEQRILFWHHYFWWALVPSLLIAIAVMSLGSNDWAAAAYIGWLAATGPWAWAVVTRRARVGGP